VSYTPEKSAASGDSISQKKTHPKTITSTKSTHQNNPKYLEISRNTIIVGFETPHQMGLPENGTHPIPVE
jgi:hypothetical protein